MRTRLEPVVGCRTVLTGYRRHPQLFTLPLRSNLALVILTVPQSHLTSYCGTRSGARRFRHWYSGGSTCFVRVSWPNRWRTIRCAGPSSSLADAIDQPANPAASARRDQGGDIFPPSNHADRARLESRPRIAWANRRARPSRTRRGPDRTCRRCRRAARRDGFQGRNHTAIARPRPRQDCGRTWKSCRRERRRNKQSGRSGYRRRVRSGIGAFKPIGSG
jgi:hypothetical protein